MVLLKPALIGAIVEALVMLDDDAVLDDQGLVGTGGGFPRQRIDMHVAGRDHAPRGGYADLWAPEVRFGETDSAQHCAARRLLHAVNDDTGVAPQILLFHCPVLSKSTQSCPGPDRSGSLAWSIGSSRRTLLFVIPDHDGNVGRHVDWLRVLVDIEFDHECFIPLCEGVLHERHQQAR